MSPLNFERQDITASIIPGGLLVFGYLAILGNLESVLYSDSVLIVGVFIVASFITGDIVQIGLQIYSRKRLLLYEMKNHR